MNLRFKKLLGNFSYAVTSNLISLIVSILIVLILPKNLGIEEYGYFQLYIFYTSYVGVLHFGWNDGIYLRYGGQFYKNLDYKLFNSQFMMLLFSQILISSSIIGFSLLYNFTETRMFILYSISLVLIIINVRYMLIFVLQATNRIKEYAYILFIERVFFVLLLTFFLLGDIDFKVVIILDICSKIISFIAAIFYCKEIVFNKSNFFHFNFQEVQDNINSGFKLMTANFASILIIGVIRFAIERSWDITTFAKVSLTLNISNFLMIFINAIGIVLFPILKRVEVDQLIKLYVIIRELLSVFLLGILILFYPFKIILYYWLPEYQQSLIYLGLIFPIIIYEGKTSLLLNTYFKVLRMEKTLLKVNIITLVLSLTTAFFLTVLFKELELTILSMLILLMFKSLLAEKILMKKMNVFISRNAFLEIFLTFIFVIVNCSINNTYYSFTIYAISYLFYLAINKNKITFNLKKVKQMM